MINIEEYDLLGLECFFRLLRYEEESEIRKDNTS